MDKAFNLNSFSEEVKVYPDPIGSWLPLVQNNLHAKVSCAGEASSEPQTTCLPLLTQKLY